MVAILDKGILGYAIQLPFNQTFTGWFGGVCDSDFPIPPYYVHLVKYDSSELTLNHFFVKLMAQLTFFRKRSSIDFGMVLGPGQSDLVTIQGYQYNLMRQLVEADETHTIGNFVNPKIRYNLYLKSNRTLIGQVCLLPWKDGAVITVWSRIDPRMIYKHYYDALKLNGIIVPASTDKNMWFSSVLSINEELFIKASEIISSDIIVVKDSDDNNRPPFKI